jgi:2-methylisocitrate lyase-like PEP mutase family enzyme
MDTKPPPVDRARRFAELHEGEQPLLLPNAWDAASAKLCELLGFPAVGTTSGGIALSLGYADGERLTRDAMLDVVKRIADSVSVPVTADMEAGYADSPDGVAETVRMTIDAGAVGCNLEDSVRAPRPILLPIRQAARRIEAAREAADEAGIPFVVNARTDGYLWRRREAPDPFEDTIARARAYAEAGADCIFVPGVSQPDLIGRLVQAISLPLNVMAVADTPRVAVLRELGVKRMSLGTRMYGAAMGFLRRSLVELRANGSFEFMRDGIPLREMEEWFSSAK